MAAGAIKCTSSPVMLVVAAVDAETLGGLEGLPATERRDVVMLVATKFNCLM